MSQSVARKKNVGYLKHKILDIDSKHFSGTQNVSPDNVFLFET